MGGSGDNDRGPDDARIVTDSELSADILREAAKQLVNSR